MSSQLFNCLVTLVVRLLINDKKQLFILQGFFDFGGFVNPENFYFILAVNSHCFLLSFSKGE